MYEALSNAYGSDSEIFPLDERVFFRQTLQPDYTLDSVYRFFFFLVTEIGPQVVPFVRILVTNILVWYRKAIELMYRKHRQEQIRTGTSRKFRVGDSNITQDSLNFLNDLKEDRFLIYIRVFNRVAHSPIEWWRSLYTEARRDERYLCTKFPEKDIVNGKRSKQKWNAFKTANKFPYTLRGMCACYGCVRSWCIVLYAIKRYISGVRVSAYDIYSFCW